MTPAEPIPVVLVSGLSGAGHSSALKILEDIGYEAVDNLPLTLLQRLVLPADEGGRGAAALDRPLAIGVDVRTRDFGLAAFLAEASRLREIASIDVRLLFLDCDTDTLLRRYSETRRRHPLAADRPVRDGIERERQLLVSLRDRADVVIDTSTLNLWDLKRLLSGHFAIERAPGLACFVVSFAYRGGVPRDADLVFDARFLRNPNYEADLKPHDGRDPAVAAYIEADPGLEPFFASLTGLLGPLLPRFAEEGKSYLTIAIGCTGGRHRSVYLAERLAAWLRQQGQTVELSHRDLRPPAAPG